MGMGMGMGMMFAAKSRCTKLAVESVCNKFNVGWYDMWVVRGVLSST